VLVMVVGDSDDIVLVETVASAVTLEVASVVVVDVFDTGVDTSGDTLDSTAEPDELIASTGVLIVLFDSDGDCEGMGAIVVVVVVVVDVDGGELPSSSLASAILSLCLSSPIWGLDVVVITIGIGVVVVVVVEEKLVL